MVKVFRDRYPDIPVKCISVLESDFFQKKYDAVISIGLIFLLNEESQFKMINRVSESVGQLHRNRIDDIG
jgi:hypothetical protein